MVENLAQQTANQIVDKFVSSDANKVESAYSIFADKLYTDVYKTDPSPQAATKFLDDVFADVNAQYTGGKALPHDLALAWANQQLGHELPAAGFDKDDLDNIRTSTASSVTALDKFMAGVLENDYAQLQKDSMDTAITRVEQAHYCGQVKQIADQSRADLKLPPDAPVPGIPSFELTCNATPDPGDLKRAAGVVRVVSTVDLQASLKDLDAKQPMKFWW